MHRLMHLQIYYDIHFFQCKFPWRNFVVWISLHTHHNLFDLQRGVSGKSYLTQDTNKDNVKIIQNYIIRIQLQHDNQYTQICVGYLSILQYNELLK